MRSPLPSIRIRPALSDDASAANHLQQEVERIHAQLRPDFFKATSQPNLFFEQSLADPNQTLQIAYQEQNVVGLVRGTLFDAPADPTMVATRRLHVDLLVVAPHARRHGIGRKLLKAAEDWGRKRGAKQAVLTVWDGNTSAQRFYDALGYRILHSVLVSDL